MTEFVASNGIGFRVRQDTFQYKSVHADKWQVEMSANSDYMAALREYFLHERDTELGRWRWAENPDYVVYGKEREYHPVLHEPTGVLGKRTGDTGGDIANRAVAAYIAAHPAPKPWRDAKPGEVWEITYRSPRGSEISNRVMTCVDDGGNISFFNDYRLHTIYYTGIESAHRIWPEVS